MTIFSRWLGCTALAAAAALALAAPPARADEQTVKRIALLISEGILTETGASLGVGPVHNLGSTSNPQTGF